MKRNIVIVCALLLAGLGLVTQPWSSRAEDTYTTIQLSSIDGWSDKSVGTWDGVTGTLLVDLPQGTGIQIMSDGVVLDGGIEGHTVTGNGSGAGVYLNGRTGVTVTNITATGFTYGIFLSGSAANTVSGCNVSGNATGIRLKNANDNTLEGNTSEENTEEGFRLELSHHNTLRGNSASNNKYGIFLTGSEDSLLTDNTVEWSSADGIYLQTSNGSTLTGNTVSDNKGYGLRLTSGTGNQVYRNRFLNASDAGHAVTADDNTFFDDDDKEPNNWGNYWDTYEGVDEEEPFGIGDDPYAFDSSHLDKYPWLEPDGWDAPPPATTPAPEPAIGETPTIGETFVTGGGWLNPPQASIPGKAHVEVECRYAEGAEIPTGKLDLKVGKLHFRSTSFDLLSIDNGQAWCHGQGSAGDDSVYTFILAVVDAPEKGRSNADKVRIKVWDDETGAVLYDSQPGADDSAAAEADLSGGSITIHKD